MNKIIDSLPPEIIEQKIFVIRGQKVMLSPELARLYGVEPKVLIQAVKRNRDRFPEDFMFQLSNEETQNLKSQFVISSLGKNDNSSRSQFVTLNKDGKQITRQKRGQNIKYLPYAFTEHGIAMLSSVLKSKKAVQVNIAIVRTFVRLRQLLATHKYLADKFKELERKFEKHDGEIKSIFEVIRQLMAPKECKTKIIGFRAEKYE